MTTQLTMYGIKNCDTIKKARRYLDEQNVNYRFHDYRADGIDRPLLERFTEQLGYEALLNTRGTTWRKLSDDEKQLALADKANAIDLMVVQPAIIKRPLLTFGNRMLLGFSPQSYAEFLAGSE